ncbi:class I SAM-dependent methyltransferase [Nitrospira sp. Nam74]
MSIETLKEHWSGFFRDKVFFSYYRCNNCKALYCPKFFSNDQLTQLYSVMPHNMAGLPLKALQRTQQGYFEILRRFSSLEGDYLEVGPDQGFLAQLCAQQGRFKHFWLFEPNLTVHPELERKVAGIPHRIFAGMFDFAEIPKSRISVLSMVHVLDHLVEPRRILEDMKPTLVDNAVVVFVTHDESSLLCRLLQKKWPPYCLQHPQLFNPNTITRLLDLAGYQVLCVRKSHNHYPLGYLLKHVAWAVGVRAMWLPDWFRLPLRLGNIITVATPSRR